MVSLLEPGRTCFRIAHASRVSLLVDAAAYFAALREAMLVAERSIFIVGWDVDTRVRLVGERAPTDELPLDLMRFLRALLHQKPSLHVNVVSWDFSVIYAFERELLPSYKFSRVHPRLHFVLDGNHPVGAAHHQKLVVIDDRVAFCGGIDLTIRRWDTPAHRPRHAGRRDPAGAPYGPMHDVQLAVEGEAAAQLGELARQRFAQATGTAFREPAPAPRRFWQRRSRPSGGDLWPSSAAPLLRDVGVGIARTQPALDGSGADVREICELTLAALDAARELVFIENQYLTAASVAERLAERLQAEQGPEIVVILPKVESGWLEQSSMGALRQAVLARLRRADLHGRFHVYSPVLPNLGAGQCLNVHSKLLVIDDRLLKVGSSNLSNRSLGLDTECDLAIEAPDSAPADHPTRLAIRGVVSSLLAEHLGLMPAEVAARLSEHRSVPALIEARRGTPRCLEPLIEPPSPALNLAPLQDLVVDPERPVAADEVVRSLVPDELEKPAARSLVTIAALLLPLLVIGAAWRFTPLAELATVERIGELVKSIRSSPLSLLYVVVAYVALTSVFCPITVLIAGTALAFDRGYGFLYALLGSLASAACSYWVGRLLGRAPVKKLMGPRMRLLRASLRRRAFRATVAARLLPLGNFTGINLMAGALLVPFRAFMLGNLAGLVPGVLGLTLFAGQLEAVFREPNVINVSLLVVVGALLAFVFVWLGRVLERRTLRGSY